MVYTIHILDGNSEIREQARINNSSLTSLRHLIRSRKVTKVSPKRPICFHACATCSTSPFIIWNGSTHENFHDEFL